MRINEALRSTSKELAKAGITNPAMEARILLQYVTCSTKEYLLAHSDEVISDSQSALLSEIIQRRQNFEPIAYIIGTKEFFSREFIVNPHILIPRPDSEILIETVFVDYKNISCHSREGGDPENYILDSRLRGNDTTSNNQHLNILDLGTGSGSLIITLLLELQNATGVAVDTDINALNVAKANALKHGVHDIAFVLSNWFDEMQDLKFDIIVANPPYISSSDRNVAKETILHEPHLALFAENNGLEAYEIIANRAKNFLKPQGALYLEIGYDQHDVIVDLYTKQGYKLKTKARDLAGHVRCLKFQIG